MELYECIEMLQELAAKYPDDIPYLSFEDGSYHLYIRELETDAQYDRRIKQESVFEDKERKELGRLKKKYPNV